MKTPADFASTCRLAKPSRSGLHLPLLLLFLPGLVLGASLGPAFTYQGRLSDGALPAFGNYDLTFGLYDALSDGNQIGTPQTNTMVAVSNGLFTVSLDFGSAPFDGQARWLEVAVRKGTNAFTVLAPRQPLNATPYALAATTLTAPLSTSLLPSSIPQLDANQLFNGTNMFSGPATLTNSANLFGGFFAGDGSALTNINSTAVRRLMASSAPMSGTNYTVDFAADVSQLNATTNINFLQSTNRASPGLYAECVWYIQGGATNRLLTFNPDWTPIGTLATNNPYLLMSNKLLIVAFSVRGQFETNVLYAIARQE